MQRIGRRPAGPVPAQDAGFSARAASVTGKIGPFEKTAVLRRGQGPVFRARKRRAGKPVRLLPPSQKQGVFPAKGGFPMRGRRAFGPIARSDAPRPLARPNMPGSPDSTAAKRTTRPPEDGRPFRALKAGARPIPAGPAKRDASGGTARSRRFHWPGGGAPRRICSRFPSPGIAAGTLCRTARRTLNPLPARKSGWALAIRRTVGGVSVPLDEKTAAALY